VLTRSQDRPANPMEIVKFWRSELQKTTEPIDKKFGVGDYVGNNYLHAKTQNDCLIGGMAAYV